MEERKITLTQQEIEDIKDTATFRAKVIVELKRLCSLPQQVTTLKVWSRVQWLLLSAIIAALVVAAVNGWAK